MKELVIDNKKNVQKFSDLISKCHSCQINKTCKHFKTNYSKACDKVNKNIQERKEKIMSNGAWNEVGKSIELEKLEGIKKQLIARELTDSVKSCNYERDVVETTFEALSIKYPLQEYPHLLFLFEQIIKLKLYDVRLMILHNKYGLLRETKTGVRSVAGMHYSMEIADKVTNILEKIEKIAYGDKMTNVNINVDINGAIVDAWKKRVSDDEV